MKKIILSEPHRRTLSSSIKVVEKLLNEIEMELKYPGNGILNIMENNIDESTKYEMLETITNAKNHIHKLVDKYELSGNTIQFNNYLNSCKSSIWEILSDTASKKMKAYGVFPKEFAHEFDQDINQLQILINEL